MDKFDLSTALIGTDYESDDLTFDGDFSTTGLEFEGGFEEQTFVQYDSREHYQGGAYDITPLVTSQLFNTKDKIMDDDVKVEVIPTREEPNKAGGVTFIIG